MKREEAREYINDQLPRELTKARKKIQGKDSYICPLCGNGSGKDGTGLTTKDGKHWSCWKGCFTSADYLDILKQQHGTTNERDIFARFGLEIDGDGQGTKERLPTMTDNRAFILQVQKSLQESPEAFAYLRSRGISLKTAAAAGVGYDPAWKSPTALVAGKNPPASERLIFPTSGGGYTARAIDADTPPNLRYMKEGVAGFFNLGALIGADPVYITEGAINALSVMEVGGAAVAIGSTSSVDNFLAALDRKLPTAPLILSLDNDAPGKSAQEKLKAGLESRTIRFTESNISGEYNDANDALRADKDAFSALVHSDPAEATRLEAEDAKAEYLYTAAAFHVGDFRGAVRARANTPATATGFKSLDNALDGGLYEGLYIFGALSSIGKTTFALQMADQIAARAGRDVLVFSLEMSRHELIAKSLSRLTLQLCEGKTYNAKTTRGLLDGARWREYSPAEHALINTSCEEYARYASRLFIHEGIGNIGVEAIRHEVTKHITFTGNAPVVVIDYLQIIAPTDSRATDKQNTDKAVIELKRLSRDVKIPVFAISSFNRDNYTAPVNMASYKESGAIEYSSDVLLGLQLTGMDELSQSESKRSDTIRKIDILKLADPRRAQLKILKNRNGRIGDSLYFNYYPKFNTFKETLESTTEGVF